MCEAVAGGVDATPLFDIGVAPPAPPPSPTDIKLFAPADDIGPRVPMRMVLSDPDSAQVDVLVEYKLGTGGWTPATPAPDSDGMTRIPAPLMGGNHRLIWDALTDLGVRQGRAALRVTVSKGGVMVSQETSAAFAVNTAPPPPPPPLGVKTPVTVSQMTAAAGAGQHGISGHLLPEPMRVLVVDGNGRPIQGVRVTFTAKPPAGAATPIADIERDPGYWTTTDGQGHASVRVRVRKGVVPTTTPVSASIEARVVGQPSRVVTFPFTVHRPKIESHGMLAQLSYGQEYRIRIGLLGRGTDIFSPEYRPDPANPRVLEVTASANVEVAPRKIHLPDAGGSATPTIRFVPTDPNLPVIRTMPPWPPTPFRRRYLRVNRRGGHRPPPTPVPITRPPPSGFAPEEAGERPRRVPRVPGWGIRASRFSANWKWNSRMAKMIIPKK